MGRARSQLEAILLEFLSKRGMTPDDEIAVAYSGGPDSTALLAAFSAIGWRKPIAIYVDHGIRSRDELNAELELVDGVCTCLGARLIVAHVRPGAVLERAKATGDGVEAEARRFRYAAFRAVLERTGVKALLIAHTKDDQIETLLMRLFGGSDAGDLVGIPEATGPFMRPFLGIGKASLLSYLDDRRIAFSLDSTNTSTKFLRNRVRSALVPALDASFPGWRKGLILTAAKAARDGKALSAAADALAFSPSSPAAAEFSITSAHLLEAPEAVAVRSIVRAAGKLLGKARFSSRMAAAALTALRGDASSGYRGAGLELSIREGLAILRRGLDFPRHGGYFVLIDRPRRVRVGSIEVMAAWNIGSRVGIRADAFRFPLVVRSRRPGDAIALKDGTKLLDALFSEWALPKDARRAAPIVEDRDGIVAVLGAELGGKDRYRECPFGECERRLSVIVKGA
ncbi:MAG: tRNA lysidine(34) synthetase TilS [Rectinemataceae bacterium]